MQSKKKVKIKGKCKKVTTVNSSFYLKKPKRKINTKSIVSLIMLFVMGISSGVVAGDWFLTNFIGGPSTDYTSLRTEAELRQGNDIIALGYKNKTPSAQDAWKSFIAAESNLANADSFAYVSNGLVDTIVKQTVYSKKTFDGTSYHYEQISDGLVSVVDKYTFTPSLYNAQDETTFIQHSKGTLNSSTTASEYLDCPFDCVHGDKNAFEYDITYSQTSEPLTSTEYAELMGGTINSCIPYIVSEKTVKSCSDFKTITSGSTTKYCFKLSLDNQESVINYVKQMKTASGLTDYPSFSSIVLSVSLVMIDNLVMFDSLDVLEHYSVKYGALSPKCVGSLHQKFIFD